MIRAAIIAAMQDQSVSQAGLAAATGIRQPAISRWLCGHCDISGRTLEKIMAALHLHITKEHK